MDMAIPVITNSAIAKLPDSPLISVIIISWNYGVYLGRAMESVKLQTYQNFEVIIVDNGSSDDTQTIAKKHIGSDMRFRIVTLEENLGQLGAFMYVYPELKGDFVVSLDADDMLISTFIATHVQAHLALIEPVALTSSDVVIIGKDNEILMHGYKGRGRHKPDAEGLAPIHEAPRISQVNDDAYVSLADATTTHHGPVHWIWGPGTSNMYRKSVLDIIYEKHEGPWMRSSDNFLNPIANAVQGTALIDEELSAYRIHGDNYYGSLQVAGGGRRDRSARLGQLEDFYDTTDAVLRRAKEYSKELGERYWDVLHTVSAFVASPAGKVMPGTPETLALLEKNYPTLRTIFGVDVTIEKLNLSFMPGDVMITALRAGDQIKRRSGSR